MKRLLEPTEITNLLSDPNSLRDDRFEIINPAWLAGFIDGEGSLYFTAMSSGYKMPRISIALTNYDILNDIKSIYGGSISEMKELKGNAKIAWKWQLSGSVRLKNLLTDIQPFLKLKYNQAILLLEFLDLLLSSEDSRKLGISEDLLMERQAIITEVTRLNKRGKN